MQNVSHMHETNAPFSTNSTYPTTNQTPRQIPIRNSRNTLWQRSLEIGDPIWAGRGKGCSTVFTALFQRIITSAFGVYRWL